MTPTRHCVAAGQLLTLPARAGQLARCASGVLWLTAGDGDVVLRPGDSYPVPADGPLLVEAADQGVLLLESPNPQARRRPRPRRYPGLGRGRCGCLASRMSSREFLLTATRAVAVSS